MLEGEDQLKEDEKIEEKKVERSKLFKLLGNNKLDVFLGAFGALISGGIMPISGFVLSKSVNTLSQSDGDKVKKDGLLYSMMFLCVSFGNAICNFCIYKNMEISNNRKYNKNKKISN